VKTNFCRFGGMLAILLLAVVSATAADHKRDVFVLTSTNNPTGNEVAVFELNVSGTPSLSLVTMLPTGGNGGASGNAGILQFRDQFGAVANYGSNTVSQLVRDGDSISVGQIIKMTQNCMNPDSDALADGHLFVVGANCAESRVWPWAYADGRVVAMPDTSAAQIVAGQSWAAVTLKSGSVLQLPLARNGALNGNSLTVTLPSNANNTPLGAAFWGDILGFNPAHSPDSFALVNKNGDVFPVLGPQPSYPSNAHAGWPRDLGTSGIRATVPARLSLYSSATGKAGHFTSPCRYRAYRPT